jgi:transposase
LARQAINSKRVKQEPVDDARGSLGSRAELRRRLERAERERDELRRQNEQLQKQVVDKDKTIAHREKQIADLERQLAAYRKDSTNSSKPPSTDRPKKTKKQCYPRRKKSKRKPGGQKGHPGKHRPPVPPERVDQTVVVDAKACQHCGSDLPKPGDPGYQTEGDVQRHQVMELPPLRAHITEYECPKVVCPCCQNGTRAPLPKEAQSDYGHRLAALVAFWTVTCRMPRRVVESVLELVLEIPISLGSTQKLWEEAGDAVEVPCQQLEQQLQREAVLNVDGSGWFTNGLRRCILVFVAAKFVCYRVVESNNWEVLVSLLGAAFAGVLCSDRGSEYRKYRRKHPGLIQYCWSHLKRNIQAVLDFATTEEGKHFCRDTLAIYARVFRLWHQFRRNVIDRPQLMEKVIRLEKKLFFLAERHLDSAESEVRTLAQALFVNLEHLFTFVYREGVEPTNNWAERALRIAVQWRKVMFGNRSARGEVTVARLLTVTQTCLRQKRSTLDYLAEAIRCHRRGEPAPSLLPPQ